jgi:hypothetical protein
MDKAITLMLLSQAYRNDVAGMRHIGAPNIAAGNTV